ncbi:hypothetical protein AKJ16_DCAP09144 [Drosera capensis]
MKKRREANIKKGNGLRLSSKHCDFLDGNSVVVSCRERTKIDEVTDKKNRANKKRERGVRNPSGDVDRDDENVDEFFEF